MACLAEFTGLRTGDYDSEVGKLGAGGCLVGGCREEEMFDGEEGALNVVGVGLLPE